MIEVIGAILGSLGGATLIVSVFANYLGKIWTERITSQVHAKNEQQLEGVKAQYALALEIFNRKADAELKDLEIFSVISQEVYQAIFKERVNTYTKLLEIKNNHLKDMHEDYFIEESERWSDVYVSSYKELHNVIIEKQLYISTDLDNAFHELRLKAASHLRQADFIKANESESMEQYETFTNKQDEIYQQFAQETYELMKKVLNQISIDVAKLRSRIDLDRV